MKNLKNILIHYISEKELLFFAKKYVSGRLIVIGCGTKPYRELFRPFVTEHIGVDHESTMHNSDNIDLFGSAYCLPVGDKTFDSALCTAVLEHLEEPELSLRECYRVLKSNGIAIYMVPFIWHLHEEPRDFYRFSKYGLDYLFRKTNFEILEIKAMSGFWITFTQMFIYNLYRFNIGPFRWFKIIDAIGLILQMIAYLLNLIDRTEQWTWAYIVVARKKISVSAEK
jgi:SAM-dependent methyltransferase